MSPDTIDWEQHSPKECAEEIHRLRAQLAEAYSVFCEADPSEFEDNAQQLDWFNRLDKLLKGAAPPAAHEPVLHPDRVQETDSLVVQPGGVWEKPAAAPAPLAAANVEMARAGFEAMASFVKQHEKPAAPRAPGHVFGTHIVEKTAPAAPIKLTVATIRRIDQENEMRRANVEPYPSTISGGVLTKRSNSFGTPAAPAPRPDAFQQCSNTECKENMRGKCTSLLRLWYTTCKDEPAPAAPNTPAPAGAQNLGGPGEVGNAGDGKAAAGDSEELIDKHYRSVNRKKAMKEGRY
jgi:hypothetical protein